MFSPPVLVIVFVVAGSRIFVHVSVFSCLSCVHRLPRLPRRRRTIRSSSSTNPRVHVSGTRFPAFPIFCGSGTSFRFVLTRTGFFPFFSSPASGWHPAADFRRHASPSSSSFSTASVSAAGPESRYPPLFDVSPLTTGVRLLSPHVSAEYPGWFLGTSPLALYIGLRDFFFIPFDYPGHFVCVVRRLFSGPCLFLTQHPSFQSQ